MAKVLVDTDIIIDLLRGYPQALDFFERRGDTILFSAITETELLAGSANDNPEYKTVILQLLQQWVKISVGNPEARIAGDLCRMHNMHTPDALIAACALCSNAELLTRNLKHFKGVQKLRVRSPY